MVAMYGPTVGEDEEWERFLNYLDRVIDRVGNGCRLCALGDLNGAEASAGINGGFGVPG